jgi:hypothetical protein
MDSVQATDGENRDESIIQKQIEEPLTVDRENTSNGSDGKNNCSVDNELLSEQDIQFHNNFIYHADRLEFPKAVRDKLKYSIKLEPDMWNNITSFY